MPIRSRQALQEHRLRHPTCQLTHLIGCCRAVLGETHHIQMGTGNRHDVWWNLVTVCHIAHRQIHSRGKAWGLVVCYTALAQDGPVPWETIRLRCGRSPLARVEMDLASLESPFDEWARKLLEAYK